jgi:hypothetical protein
MIKLFSGMAFLVQEKVSSWLGNIGARRLQRRGCAERRGPEKRGESVTTRHPEDPEEKTKVEFYSIQMVFL